MKNYNRGGSFGGNSNFGGRRDYQDRGNREDRQMFHAICSKCGRDCEVPFRPTGEKPVYCSNCFEKQNSYEGGESFRREDRGRSRDFGRRPPVEVRRYDESGTTKQLEALNAKLDKLIELLSAGAEKPKKKAKKDETVLLPSE